VTVSGNYPTESVFAFRKPSVDRSEIIRSVFTPGVTGPFFAVRMKKRLSGASSGSWLEML
jgi:hypothetical protein